MIVHILKFAGPLCLMSLVLTYIPFGALISGAVVMVALWKITD